MYHEIATANVVLLEDRDQKGVPDGFVRYIVFKNRWSTKSRGTVLIPSEYLP